MRPQPYTGDVAGSAVRHDTIVSDREDGIQIVDCPGIASRRPVLVDEVVADGYGPAWAARATRRTTCRAGIGWSGRAAAP